MCQRDALTDLLLQSYARPTQLAATWPAPANHVAAPAPFALVDGPRRTPRRPPTSARCNDLLPPHTTAAPKRRTHPPRLLGRPHAYTEPRIARPAINQRIHHSEPGSRTPSALPTPIPPSVDQSHTHAARTVQATIEFNKQKDVARSAWGRPLRRLRRLPVAGGERVSRTGGLSVVVRVCRACLSGRSFGVGSVSTWSRFVRLDCVAPLCSLVGAPSPERLPVDRAPSRPDQAGGTVSSVEWFVAWVGSPQSRTTGTWGSCGRLAGSDAEARDRPGRHRKTRKARAENAKGLRGKGPAFAGLSPTRMTHAPAAQ